jgi:hypothetical protein
MDDELIDQIEFDDELSHQKMTTPTGKRIYGNVQYAN